MPRFIRSTDVIESIAEKAIVYGIGGIVSFAFGLLLYVFRGDGWLVGLADVLMLGGLACVAISAYCSLQVRKVKGIRFTCPFCDTPNYLLETPTDDFPCLGCNRMIPIEDGKIMKVEQVRCGYCNALNFYSDKTEILLCENCNHEIPIMVDEGKRTKRIPAGFAVTEDEQLYELQLIAIQHRSDELITCLQQMLALNRNQVKQMFDDLPVTLLTGIPRKKAEMLAAQIGVHDASAAFHPIGESATV